MKKLITLLILITLLFYAAWPAYSLYVIANGIHEADEMTIARKVAWVPLRQSLREPVAERVRREINKQTKGSGLEGQLAGQLASEMTPKLVEQVLDAYVTPKGVISLAKRGGKLNIENLGIGGMISNLGADKSGEGGLFSSLMDKAKQMVGSSPEGKDLMATTIGKITKELSGKIQQQSDVSGDVQTTGYGLANIKHFKFINPWSFELGLAKSPDATTSDIIAGLSFIDRDWKLSKLIPRL